MGFNPSVNLLRRARLRKGLAKERQQVAAVCYRMGKRGIEFLLVQSRGGRWIFPKGGVECGLTQAQSAAVEAFEEAGVHGWMEEIPFAHYFRSPRDATATTAARTKDKRLAGGRFFKPELPVAAHLCEVTRLEPPQEANRNPTWFSAEKAKQRLLHDHAPEFGAELVRVVERAWSRIQRLQSVRKTPDRTYRDGLQEVRFEAFEEGRFPRELGAAFVRNFFRQHRGGRSSLAIEAAVAQLQKVPQIGGGRGIPRPVLRLSAGTGSPAETRHKITLIDSGRTTRSSN
jgi:8-oxo-dGTP pyrophosphatase MutT (NUDIX family)